RVNAAFGWLREQAERDRGRSGADAAAGSLALLLDLRFSFQLYELRVEVPRWPLSEADLGDVLGRFAQLYEQRFGARTAVANAPIEIAAFHALFRVPSPHTTVPRPAAAAAAGGDSRVGTRPVYFD